MKRKRKWNQLIGRRIGDWPGAVLVGREDGVDFGLLRQRTECLKRRVFDNIVRLCFASFLIAAWTVWPAAPARADAAQGHLTLDEIIVTEDAASEPMGTEVGAKKIEKGKNINIPDVLKSEPDIDIKRRTLIGDTADSLAIRGFSGNRIMLNIDGRPVNASGVVDPYVTADIDLKFPIGRYAEVSGYVENLFDEEYEEQFGYPMPGIVIGAALELFL